MTDEYQVEKVFRGISQRLAVHYLRNLDGRPIVDGVEHAAESDVESEGVSTVVGDGWKAALDSTKVNPAGSLMLTEVAVTFVGEPDVVDPLVKAFSQKAMRAGG